MLGYVFPLGSVYVITLLLAKFVPVSVIVCCALSAGTEVGDTPESVGAEGGAVVVPVKLCWLDCCPFESVT